MREERFLQVAGKFFESIKKNFSVLSPNQQTQSSWLKRIKDIEDVPPEFRSTFEQIVQDRSEFPYILLTPSYVGDMKSVSEKLIFWMEDRVYELEMAAGEIKSRSHLQTQITYLEAGNALLNSWVKICSIAEDQEFIKTEFKFNTATEHILAPVVKNIRSREESKTVTESEFSFTPYLDQHLKLVNFAQRSMLPGENVLAFILQPEIQKQIFKIFGRAFYRTEALSHLCILTDHELILFHEGIRGPKGESRYGGVYHYICLDKIAAIDLAAPQEDHLSLSIRLTDGACFEVLFLESNWQAVRDFLNQYKSLRKH